MAVSLASRVAVGVGAAAATLGLAVPAASAATGGVWSSRVAGAERVGDPVVSGNFIYQLYDDGSQLRVKGHVVRGKASVAWTATIPATVDAASGFSPTPDGQYSNGRGTLLYPEVDALNVSAAGAVVSSRWCPDPSDTTGQQCLGAAVTRYKTATGEVTAGPESGTLAGTQTTSPIISRVDAGIVRFGEPFGGTAFPWSSPAGSTAIGPASGRYVIVANTKGASAAPASYVVYDYRTGGQRYSVTARAITRAAGEVASDSVPAVSLTPSGQLGVEVRAKTGGRIRAVYVDSHGTVKRVSRALAGVQGTATMPGPRRIFVVVRGSSSRSRCSGAWLTSTTGRTGFAFGSEKTKLAVTTIPSYFDGRLAVFHRL